MSEWTRTPRLLQGIRLLEIGERTVGFCGKVLADLGAEVAKIELGSGIELPSLAPDADVVLIEGGPDALNLCGVSWEDLRKSNPRLIFASLSPFGHSGPRRNWQSCDLVAAAAGGQLYVTGAPGREPLVMPGSQALHLGAFHAAVGILLALLQREATGQGSRVDVSLQEAVASGLDHVLVRYFADGSVPARNGSRQWNDSTVVVPCSDGHLLVFPFLQWDTLVEWMDADGSAGDLLDPVYRDSEHQRRTFDHIVARIAAWTSLRTRAELFETAQLMRLPWAPVFAPEEVLDSPQLRGRNFFASLVDGGAGAGSPYLFSVGPQRASVSEGTRPRRSLAAAVAPAHGPLEGVRVLDFTRVLAGPFATRILSDFGAEVIKVQTRRTVGGAEADDQPYFAMWNRNKQSITVDLGHPEGRALILDLVRKCDVVAENYAPRVMDNWALGHEALREVNPNVVLLRMSAAGQTGPWRDTVAFGPTIHALSGLTHSMTYRDGPPIGPGFAYSDVVAGLYGSLAILSALRNRIRTGRGCAVDLSEYEAVVGLMDPALWDRRAAAEKGDLQKELEESRLAAPYGCFRCRGEDRWCAIAVFNEDQWRRLCTILDLGEMANDLRFHGVKARQLHAVELRALLEARTALLHASEFAEKLQAGGIPAAPVEDARDLAEDEHLKESRFFASVCHPRLGKFISDRGAIRIEGWEVPLRPAPLLGEHNERVFRKLLGWSDAKLAVMSSRGVIS